MGPEQVCPGECRIRRYHREVVAYRDAVAWYHAISNAFSVARHARILVRMGRGLANAIAAAPPRKQAVAS